MNNWMRLKDIKKFEIELSSHCNARCPLCVRQYLGTDKERVGLEKGHLGLDQIKKLIEQLPRPGEVTFYFAGVSGDPLMNPEFDKILDYCCTHLKKVQIDTNGSLRSKTFWRTLGAISKKHGKKKGAITFSIDGLEDTNHLYRIRTDFNKIMENAKAFIKSGGIAEWKYIIFKHNRHQVKDARRLAKQMGFDTFISTPSTRHYDPDWEKKVQALIPKTTKIVKHKSGLQPEKTDTVPYRPSLKDVRKFTKEIKCKVLEKQMMYISHTFDLFPCCFIHSWQVHEKTSGVFSKMYEDVFTGWENSLNKRPINDIIKDRWFNDLIDKWADLGPGVCVENCNQTRRWDMKWTNKDLKDD